jgi:hypothetical protein
MSRSSPAGPHTELWAAAEDGQLRQLIQAQQQSHGGAGGDAVDWDAVAARMDRRTAIECHERWDDHINAVVRKGVWSEEEELLLVCQLSAHPTLLPPPQPSNFSLFALPCG